MSIQWINKSGESSRNISVHYEATDSPSYEAYPRQGKILLLIAHSEKFLFDLLDLIQNFYETLSFFTVATPRGTPSPPNAASTVARIKKPTRIIENFETSMEHVSKFDRMDILSDTNSNNSNPNNVNGDDTSLGLLPSDAVENCTLNYMVGQQNVATVDSSRLEIFGVSRLQPPTPEDKNELDIVSTESNYSPREKLSQYKPRKWP